MNAPFDPRRSDAIRSGLISSAVRPAPRKSLLWGAGLVLVGAIAGASVSAGALAATGTLSTASPDSAEGAIQLAHTPTQQAGAVPAPPGVTPGEPIISLLGDPTTVSVTESGSLDLSDAPDGATHARVTTFPLTPGELSVQIDYADKGLGFSVEATEENLEDRSLMPNNTSDYKLEASTMSLTTTVRGGFTGTMTVQYISRIPTEWEVNDNGYSYGVSSPSPDGYELSDTQFVEPDLKGVYATDPEGEEVEGYVYSAEATAFSPDHTGEPSSPEESGRWQDERDARYPNGWDIPAYESDGVTQIGVFHIE